MLAFDLARRICREASADCRRQGANLRTADGLASASTVAAVERLARADRRLAATTDQWDVDPWLLNTPSSVIDLRTGESRHHRPEDYFTKITAVAAEGDCPRWKHHLMRVLNGDAELVSYLQRVFGYALTGLTREHALFFAYGTGANGKSVTVNAVAGVLGNYHRTASIETFTAFKTDRHPTELAGLRGARLVTASETEQGRRWAESRIKMLTGGERVEARFMRQDFFEFEPQLKLLVSGNHKPALTTVDEAMRRRFHLIPFDVTIPTAERDETLPEKMQAEWPGILAWMLEGCLAWQRSGLNPPPAVLDATAEYLHNEDLFGQWLDDMCDCDPGNTRKAESVSVLYQSWAEFADSAGDNAGTMKSFSDAMQSRGFAKCRTGHKGTRGYNGVQLKKGAG